MNWYETGKNEAKLPTKKPLYDDFGGLKYWGFIRYFATVGETLTGGFVTTTDFLAGVADGEAVTTTGATLALCVATVFSITVTCGLMSLSNTALNILVPSAVIATARVMNNNVPIDITLVM